MFEYECALYKLEVIVGSSHLESISMIVPYHKKNTNCLTQRRFDGDNKTEETKQNATHPQKMYISLSF